ncbi:hypothetical protein KDK95_24490 [Actinospica sp. MGRD01-02]|uniref:Uncharacterized protein n=1 Tax=Actinospica acidithermotolerans TaxID=2828514 RepID=A0A941EDS2_9ACTN|nr:hypothetical protein [Actinospica acidithermotolerans]MBR7829487.1 hypothetical protein [Actinospica acidithermotolerans]
MTADDAALRQVLARAGEPDLVDILAARLSGSELTTLLLEVYRRRAERLSPADVVRRYRSDRFVAPGTTDVVALRRAEDLLIGALPEGFETLVLAPLVPLATHTAVATVDPRKIVATIRGSEVAADPTNALALEAATRRSRALAADSRSAAPVRLAATQRVVRAQFFDPAPGMLAHFQLFAMVTAGRDTGNRAFEKRHLVEHLRFAAAALADTGFDRVEFRLTGLSEAAAALIDHARAELADIKSSAPHTEVLADPDRASGRGYYIDLCYKIYGYLAGERIELADGGFVDWTRQLTGNRKERLLIGGFGVDRLSTSLTATGSRPNRQDSTSSPESGR